jgi:hypothetical protein
MAAGVNPAMLMALLRAKQPGGVAGTSASGAGFDSVAPAARELQAANPDYTLQLISQVKKQIVDLIPVLAFRVPGAARALMSVGKGIDAALKELQQAQATNEAVGAPIQSSAVPMPQPPGNTSPALPNPANVSM